MCKIVSTSDRRLIGIIAKNHICCLQSVFKNLVWPGFTESWQKPFFFLHFSLLYFHPVCLCVYQNKHYQKYSSHPILWKR